MPKKKTPAPTVTKWEYRIEYIRIGVFQRGFLEKLGEAGWEMCASVSTTDRPNDLTSTWPQTVMFYFKRPLRG